MRLISFAAAVVLVSGALASAQSLGDLARREEERRKSEAPAARSYSNRDLAFDPASVSRTELERVPPQQRPKVAAAQFLGYFLKHTRGYSEYCQQNWGIDLGRFVKAFSEAHQTEHARAQTIVADAGASEAQIWSASEARVRASVVIDMTAIPGTHGSMAACNGLNASATTLAREFHFSKVFPDAHRILMTDQSPR